MLEKWDGFKWVDHKLCCSLHDAFAERRIQMSGDPTLTLQVARYVRETARQAYAKGGK